MRYTFWLDMLKADEHELADLIEELKHSRSFVRMIRDGLRLVNDLRLGRVGVLLELAPWVQEYFKDTSASKDFAAMFANMANTPQPAPARELPQHPGFSGSDVTPPEDDGLSSETFLDNFL